MRDGATFAEMLDAQLGCTDVPPAAVRAWSSRPLTAPLIAFELPLARQAPPPPPPIQLTARDLQSLDDAPTPDALRRAFRTLARRLHPDRHPGCGAAEHARLARLFTQVTEHYRRLSSHMANRL